MNLERTMWCKDRKHSTRLSCRGDCGVWPLGLTCVTSKRDDVSLWLLFTSSEILRADTSRDTVVEPFFPFSDRDKLLTSAQLLSLHRDQCPRTHWGPVPLQTCKGQQRAFVVANRSDHSFDRCTKNFTSPSGNIFFQRRVWSYDDGLAPSEQGPHSFIALKDLWSALFL